MSHLAQVGLEEGFLIVRIPDAKKRYPEGATVAIDAGRGRVSVLSYGHDGNAPAGDAVEAAAPRM